MYLETVSHRRVHFGAHRRCTFLAGLAVLVGVSVLVHQVQHLVRIQFVVD